MQIILIKKQLALNMWCFKLTRNPMLNKTKQVMGSQYVCWECAVHEGRILSDSRNE